jgi:DNA-binding NarL/FixJ family response regulator
VNVEIWPAAIALGDSDPYRQIHEVFRQALAETLARVVSGQNIERLLAELVRERTVGVAAQVPEPARAPAPAFAPTPIDVVVQLATARPATAQPATAKRHLLTLREQEVLARIAAGDSNKQIARTFDLSLHTVKRHVANILSKLGVSSRAQAAAWMRAHH